jgi:hypothetical protein
MNAHRLVVAVIVVIGSACGGMTPLDGSLTSQADFSYSESTLKMEQGTLVLRFQRARGDQFDTVLKVAVALDNLSTPNHPVQWDLAEMVNGVQRGVATRNVLDDANNQLPLLLRGTLSLDSAMSGATDVTGNVTMTFVAGDTFGSGTAIFGPFDAQVMP